MGPVGEVSRDCSLRMVAWCLPPAMAPRRARTLLRTVLAPCVWDEGRIGQAELVASELATNALRHASRPYEMRVWRHGRLPVLCEIADSSPDLNGIPGHLRCPQSTGAGIEANLLLAERGRGLGIVAEMTSGLCGAYTTTLLGTGGRGKSVWFVLPLNWPLAAMAATRIFRY